MQSSGLDRLKGARSIVLSEAHLYHIIGRALPYQMILLKHAIGGAQAIDIRRCIGEEGSFAKTETKTPSVADTIGCLKSWTLPCLTVRPTPSSNCRFTDS